MPRLRMRPRRDKNADDFDVAQSHGGEYQRQPARQRDVRAGALIQQRPNGGKIRLDRLHRRNQLLMRRIHATAAKKLLSGRTGAFQRANGVNRRRNQAGDAARIAVVNEGAVDGRGGKLQSRPKNIPALRRGLVGKMALAIKRPAGKRHSHRATAAVIR